MNEKPDQLDEQAHRNEESTKFRRMLRWYLLMWGLILIAVIGGYIVYVIRQLSLNQVH